MNRWLELEVMLRSFNGMVFSQVPHKTVGRSVALEVKRDFFFFFFLIPFTKSQL